MATIAAAQPSPFAAARKLAGRVVARAYATARAGAATAVGVGGMASITVAAALLAPWAGWAVGGVLAIWLASLLPDGGKPAAGGKR